MLRSRFEEFWLFDEKILRVITVSASAGLVGAAGAGDCTAEPSHSLLHGQFRYPAEPTEAGSLSLSVVAVLLQLICQEPGKYAVCRGYLTML